MHAPKLSELTIQEPQITCGPQGRYGAVRFIEKEGFLQLFASVQLAKRYDIAIMSTKGQSVIRFPPRRIAAVFVFETDGAWLVLGPRGHGWLHGKRAAALRDAEWLAENWRLSVREAAVCGSRTRRALCALKQLRLANRGN